MYMETGVSTDIERFFLCYKKDFYKESKFQLFATSCRSVRENELRSVVCNELPLSSGERTPVQLFATSFRSLGVELVIVLLFTLGRRFDDCIVYLEGEPSRIFPQMSPDKVLGVALGEHTCSNLLVGSKIDLRAWIIVEEVASIGDYIRAHFFFSTELEIRNAFSTVKSHGLDTR